MKLNFLLIILIFGTTIVEASIKNVPLNYPSIQSGLNACLTGDTVLVQTGIYFENLLWPDVANIKLFSVGDSSNTLINGGNLDAVIVFDGDNMTITIDTNTVIKGFTIANGGCNIYCGGLYIYNNCSPKITEVAISGNYSNWGIGGGITAFESDFVLANSTVTFNMIDTNNSLGGSGIYSREGNPIIRNVIVAENTSADNANNYYGGGMCFEYCSSVTLADVSVHDNNMGNGGSSYRGGGIYFYDCSDCKLNNVAIYRNIMGNGGISYYGGGIMLYNCTLIQMANASVDSNATGSGGNYYYGGGIYAPGCDSVWFFNVSANNNNMGVSGGTNTYYNGGGVTLGCIYAVIDNLSINNNTMGDGGFDYWGGGFTLSCQYGQLSNMKINNNTMGNGGTTYKGSGLYIDSYMSVLKNVLVSCNIMGAGGSFLRGGGIYLSDSTFVTIINSTITSNNSADSSTISGSGIYYSGISNIDCSNSIFWNQNQGAEIFAAAGTTGSAIFNYSDLRGGYPGTGNIDTLPGFVSAIDFHLIPGSPCINSGTLPGAPPFDLDNMPRPSPMGTNPDMGCYEHNQPVGNLDLTFNKTIIEVIPNPFSDEITLTLKNVDFEVINLIIRDASGRIVFNHHNNLTYQFYNKIFDISQLSKGIYFYVVRNENKVLRTGKLIRL